MSPATKKRTAGVLAGFVGGLAPFLVNLAQALVGYSDLKTELTVKYFIGILLFGIIGALVAFAFGETNLKKAFFLGISAPAMISMAAKSAEKPKITSATGMQRPVSQIAFAVLSSAYAQEPGPLPPSIGGRTLEIQLNGTMPEATVAFIDPTGKEAGSEDIKLHQYRRLLIPPTATSIVVRYGDSVTNPYPLTATSDHPQYVEVIGTSGRKKLDIFSAFTGQPKILYDIRIAEPSTAPLPKGQVGWVYMGVKSNGAWQRRYLDFSGNAPNVNAILRPSADLTMRAIPNKDGERIGRIRKDQPLKFLEFTNIADGAQPNNADTDGDYYAKVQVQ